MTKRSGLPLLFFLAGAVGAVLKRWELNTVIEADTGYAVKGAPLSLGTALLLFLGVCAAYLLAVRVLPRPKRNKQQEAALRQKAKAQRLPEEAYLRPLYTVSYGAAMPGGQGQLVLSLLAAVLVLAGSLLSTDISGLSQLLGDAFDTLFRGMGIVTAVSLAVLGLASFRKGDFFPVGLAALLPALFSVLWLTNMYSAYSAGHSLTVYAAACLALAFAALALVAQAGFAFHSPDPGMALRTSLAAIFCLTFAQGQSLLLWERLILGGLTLHLLVSTTAGLLRHITPELAAEQKALRASAFAETPPEEAQEDTIL